MSEPMNVSIELLSAVSEVLFREWDPIGINCFEGIRDEYNSYVPLVSGLLASGTSEDDLFVQLSGIARDAMGLSDNASLHRAAAKRLMQLVHHDANG